MACCRFVSVCGQRFACDAFTNVTERVLAFVPRRLHLQPRHPLHLVQRAVVDALAERSRRPLAVRDSLSPVVSVLQNFDSLLVPPDHPSRARSDCYYLNETTLLRAHTTAHQVDLLAAGFQNFVVVGDVYRRDEIDSRHFPVFHQIDGVRSWTERELFPDRPDLRIFEPECESCSALKQACHTNEAVDVIECRLKDDLVATIKNVFGEQIEYRWIDEQFPFTHPSWELEIYYKNEWTEVLGCGIVRNEILSNAGCTDSIAYAFGLGLERLAMVLFDIPDIRLFWSLDTGFLNQFTTLEKGKLTKYKPISVYPQCINDVSFWLPIAETERSFPKNDFYDVVRNIGGDIIEQVQLKDIFVHPKSGKTSLCFRIVYRHMERTLTQEEVNNIHKKIEEAIKTEFNVIIR